MVEVNGLRLVESRLIEDRTDDLPDWNRDALPYELHKWVFGGGERDRTDDLLLAKQALSQLSYTPDQKFVNKFLSE